LNSGGLLTVTKRKGKKRLEIARDFTFRTQGTGIHGRVEVNTCVYGKRLLARLTIPRGNTWGGKRRGGWEVGSGVKDPESDSRMNEKKLIGKK